MYLVSPQGYAEPAEWAFDALELLFENQHRLQAGQYPLVVPLHLQRRYSEYDYTFAKRGTK